MKLELFYYDLPKKFIAQKPLGKRENSRLMVLNRRTGNVNHDFFYSIGKYLRKGDVLVLNKTKVVNCRLIGKKEKTGANIECFVLEKERSNRCLCLIKPYRRIRVGDRVIIGKDYFTVEKKLGYGKAKVIFNRQPGVILSEYGKVPLPPYIKNKKIKKERYQTIYADNGFSTAGPTAGFHFTESLIKSLKEKGIIFSSIRLDIGLDTFRPIVEDDIEKHTIHSERYFISEKEAKNISSYKKNGSRIISVGTTSTRVLETVHKKYGFLKGCRGKTSLYIYPGFDFKVIDGMITNFHLPYSTLLVMVSAFAGRENILHAYQVAKEKNYRFFSFGDCMFIV